MSDKVVAVGKWVPFAKEVGIGDTEFIEVNCWSKKGALIHKNYFAQIVRKVDSGPTRGKVDNTSATKYNVLMIGLDSTSRSRMRRHMPQVYEYITSTLKGVDFKGFTKIGDNTLPNLIPMLTGQLVVDLTRQKLWKWKSHFDAVPFIWKEYAANGYATLYGEDYPSLQTFNYHKKGFRKQPTDYYIHPLLQWISKREKKDIVPCIGNTHQTKILFNWLRDFAARFHESTGFFGLLHLNEMTHESENSLGEIESFLMDFLKEINNIGILNNTFVIIYGDHGFRFGEIRRSPVGHLEERLPFLTIHPPKAFREKFPKETDHLKNNANRLVSFPDVHATLQHVLALSTNQDTANARENITNATSLLAEVSAARTCDEARISQHWCACRQLEELKVTLPRVKRAVRFLLSHLNLVLEPVRDKCRFVSLDKILQASSSKIPTKGESAHAHDILVVVEVNPQHAVFEATVRLDDLRNRTTVVGGRVSRLSKFREKPWCIDDAILELYCFCIKKRKRKSNS